MYAVIFQHESVPYNIRITLYSVGAKKNSVFIRKFSNKIMIHLFQGHNQKIFKGDTWGGGADFPPFSKISR